MLCRAACRFNELNALLASTRITASVSSFLKINFIEWVAASAPPCNPVAICSGPAASWMSFFNTQPTHFPIILFRTSPTPIGLTPGFSRVIRPPKNPRTNRVNPVKLYGTLTAPTYFFNSPLWHGGTGKCIIFIYI